ncbi:hypothetical protein FGF1_16370 [Flavobacteriaceae bacterium GF1]
MARPSIVLMTILILSLSCKNQKGDNLDSINSVKNTFSLTDYGEGKRLMAQQCYLCHSPSASQKEGRVGPPMIAIKAHYQQHFTNRQMFLDSFVQFVMDPKAPNAKLKGAVQRFGLMPKQVFRSDEVEKMAAYLRDYQIEEPDWFEAHWASQGSEPYTNREQKKWIGEEDKGYAEIGLSYALGTKKVLGANLMGALQEKGPVEAVTFCNERAYPLTDSMSVVFNAKIKRVTDRPRNPSNAADARELKHIKTFQTLVFNNEKLVPVVEDLGEKVQFYYPIVTNDLCLKCHGNPKTDVSLEVRNLLREKYPTDKALGYGINEVRGIWSITFDKLENVEF